MSKIPGLMATLAAALVLAGCPSKPVEEEAPPPAPVTGTDVGRGGVGTTGIGAPGGYSAADLNDPRSPLFQRVIYFDYDQSEILPQFVEVLRAHAAYLAGNSKARLVLEGHADERGTREYNLALGDQRADAVRRFLVAEGAASGRIDTLSFGEERPADPNHSESAWALNRRVELVY